MNIAQTFIFAIYVVSLASMVVLIATLLYGAQANARRFILLLGSLLVWLVPQFGAQYLTILSDNERLAFIRASLFFAGLVVPALYLFVKEQIQAKQIITMSSLSIFTVTMGTICSIQPLAHINARISSSGIAVSSDRPFYYALVISVLAAFVIAVWIIRRAEKRRVYHESKQALRMLRQALTVAAALNIIGAIFLAKFEWSQILTPLSMALMATIIYVAIFKHGLFDIRSIVSRSLAYAFSLLSLSAIFIFGTFAILNLFFDGTTVSSTTTRTVYTILAIVIAFIFAPLKRFFNRITNRIFFRDAYDSQTFLEEFNKVIVSTYTLQPLLHKTVMIITENLKPDFASLYITGSKPRVVSSANNANVFKFNWDEIDKIVSTERSKVNKINTLQNIKKDSRDILRQNNVEVICKLSTGPHSDGFGYLVLGPKKSGNLFNAQDMAILEIITNELVIAIQNALRYDEIENFNLTLQQKVNEATRKLRRTNEKLKELDEAKDDFVSMASHQLRTPLTSIKGYTSMVLEGDAGKINATQRKLLEQSFFSSQRMVYLIADLLNVSRLKTGKFLIDSSPVNLAKVVEQEIGQLKESAAGRSLELTYTVPESFPDLLLDETKTRQVIMNFIDNAIYYTPAGGHIKVELLETPASVELRVTDDGIGVPKTEQPHLFTKFYRAGNARKARPDGTGLGLYMAKKVVVAEGGAIIFETQEGKGSTFGFVFSKAKMPPVAVSTPAALAASGKPSKSL